MKTRFPKVRSRIEKAFIAWHGEHIAEFKQPLQLLSRMDGQMNFTMLGLNPNIRIQLDAADFGAYADWQGQTWDILMYYDVCIELTNQGYFDELTLPDNRVPYSTRECLWQAEMFGPMMTWFNNKLLPAKWLGLYKDEGATWAKLMPAFDSTASVSLPVWLD